MIVKSAGLFVDYENISISLAKIESRPVTHEVLARRLTEIAQKYGELTLQIAWADWDRLPGAQRALAAAHYDTKFAPFDSGGQSSSGPAMQAELHRISSTGDAPPTFVVAGAGQDFLGLLEALEKSGKQVILLGVDRATSPELKKAADEFVPLLFSDASEKEAPASPLEAALPPERNGSRADGDTSESAEVLERVRWALVQLLAERHLPWISYRLFSNHLVASNIAPAESVHRWIERAVEEGYIHREEERGAVKRFCKFTPCRGSSLSGGRAHPEEEDVSSDPHYSGVPGRSRNHRWPDTLPSAPDGAPQRGSRGMGWSQDWRNFTFVRIVWALRSLLVNKPSRFYINPAALMEALRREGIGYSEEEVFFWVNQAVDKGILTREVKEATYPAGQRFYRYYLNHQNRLVYFAEEVPRAIVQTIDLILEKRTEWKGIAFNFLVKLLQVHPILSNPTYEFQSYRLREWINFLIEERLLVKSEEPDLREPTRKTTMVATNPTHLQVQRFRASMPEAPFYHPEHQAVLRTILTIDHFLYWLWTKSPDEDWLPLMTLKSWLRSSLGDQLTKWAIAECEREVFFTIERFQNKGGIEATVAGVRLEKDNPLVAQTLARRDEFLRLLISLLRNRATVPYGVLAQRLRDQPAFGDTPEERLSSLALMADSKIIAFEKDVQRGGSPDLSFICRLNAREKFVGELLTRIIRGGHSEGGWPPPDGVSRSGGPASSESATGDETAEAGEGSSSDSPPREDGPSRE